MQHSQHQQRHGSPQQQQTTTTMVMTTSTTTTMVMTTIGKTFRKFFETRENFFVLVWQVCETLAQPESLENVASAAKEWNSLQRFLGNPDLLAA